MVPERLLRKVNPEDREALKRRYNDAKVVLKEIQELVKADIEKSIRKSDSDRSYNTPNWAEAQADAIGYRRGLRGVLKLLGHEGGDNLGTCYGETEEKET